MSLNQRNIEILKIIVDEYIETWEVLWSKLLLKRYNLWVSSATVRNDMAKLEKLELIYQPYNSAWRLPTSKGLRVFVNYLMGKTPEYFLQQKNINWEKNNFRELSDYIHKISLELAKTTNEIAFFIVPEKHIIEYSWISKFLERNHRKIWDDILKIVSMFEDKFNFMNFIKEFPLNNWLNIFIWEENILPFLKDYSIILKKIIIDSEVWYIWILGSLKMNYSFNTSAVRGII